MRTIRRGLGKGLLLDVGGGGQIGYLIDSPEPDVQNALSVLLGPGMTFYDIGANIGYFALIAARLVGPTGRVVALEPAPRHLEKLRHNVELNRLRNVSIRSEALGDTDGMASFALSPIAGLDALANHMTAADRIVGYANVAVRRLDGLIEEQKLPLPDFIMMDIQGAEVAALMGARETLRRSRPVLVIELHDTAREVGNALSELDYRVYALTHRREFGASHIVALPAERDDLHRRVAEFSAPFER